MFGNGAAGGNQGGMPHPFNLMFGNIGMGDGGGGGPLTVDPLLMQQLFGGYDLGHQQWQPQPQEAPPPKTGPPPTGAAALRALPKIKVTAHDIATNEGSECSICLDELVVGQPALRIPCGHLYHEDCVKGWLLKSNECPICRYELRTDDAEYERGRSERMAGRKIRLRRADLTVKSAQELRRLADHLAVDVRGCLEKGELVECIASSEKVEIFDGRESTEHAAASSSEGFQTSVDATAVLGAAQPAPQGIAPDVSTAALAGRSVGELRRLAAQLHISLDGCLEKADVVQRIQAIAQ